MILSLSKGPAVMIYDLYEIIYCQPLTIKLFLFISWLSFFKEMCLFIYKFIIFGDIYHLDLSTNFRFS